MQRYSNNYEVLQNDEANSILNYHFEFWAPPSVATKLKQSIVSQLDPYCGKFTVLAGSWAEASYKICQKQLEQSFKFALNSKELSMFKFDHDFLPNIESPQQFDRWQLTYLVDCHNGVNNGEIPDHWLLCRKMFQLKFGHIEARIRRILRMMNLASINDNFLNFIEPRLLLDDQLRMNFHYKKLMELAERDSKVSEMVKFVDEQLAESGPELLSPEYSQRYCLSFNGGKDGTVLLHVLATLNHHHRPDSLPLNLLLIKTEETFEEIDHYVRRVCAYYRCNLWTYTGRDLKSALHTVRSDRPKLRSIFMGVRRSDLPEAVGQSLSLIQPTDVDRGWPDFVRISPLLDWSYGDIWSFLCRLEVPYCPLYNYGYSSIGYRTNTVPNLALKLDDLGTQQQNGVKYDQQEEEEEDAPIYLPAYLLERDQTERCCRV